jgi:hypothetical protein
MLDGISLSYQILDFRKWIEKTRIQFFDSIDRDSGQLKTRDRTKKEKPWITIQTVTRKGVFEHYLLTLTETERHDSKTGITTYSTWLRINGSLHKNYQKGSNFKPFRYWEVLIEIRHLCQSLNLDPTKVKIDNLEIGLNLPFWLNPFEYLDSRLLAYKTTEFIKYRPGTNHRSIGFVSDLWDYSFKIYDKGLQNDLHQNLLRVEVKSHGLSKLEKYKINYLSDLLDKEKVFSLLSLLEEAWHDVLIFDIDSLNPQIKPRERDFFREAKYSKYWIELAKKKSQKEKFQSQKKKLKRLTEKYGSGTHAKILELIRFEWHLRFENFQLFKGWNENQPTKDFQLFKDTVKVEILETSFFQSVVARTCQSCGRDITSQRKNSKFCSETKYGPEAKRCRNFDSNPRNNRKRKEDRFYRIGPTLFDVRPYFTMSNQIGSGH